MKFLLVLLTVCADISVKSPDTAGVGVPVLVDVSDSADPGPFNWETSDEQLVIYQQIRGGRQAFIVRQAKGMGRFTVTGKHGSTREAIYFTGETDDTPQPAPHPDDLLPEPDRPQPDKPLPDGKFKIATQTRDKAREVKVSKAEQRRQEAELLAGKLAGVRDRIKSGEIDAKKPAEIMTAIQRANKELPDDVQRRWSAWGTWWGKALYALYVAGTLVSQADWVAILEETILGLKAVF